MTKAAREGGLRRSPGGSRPGGPEPGQAGRVAPVTFSSSSFDASSEAGTAV